MTTDAVMDKLRKLIAHEESAREIGSLAEAEAFAAKIQQLLIEHKLEMAEVKAADDHDEERAAETVDEEFFNVGALGTGYSGKQRVAWLETLADIVANAHFCRILVAARSANVWFVGTPTDRRVAGSVFANLVRGAIAACDAEYNRARRDPWQDTRGFRKSFYTGFNHAIFERLRRNRKEAEQASASTALVLRNADTAVAQYIEQKFKGKKGSASSIGSNSNFNEGAYASGKAAGSRASMNAGISSGGSRGSLPQGRF